MKSGKAVILLGILFLLVFAIGYFFFLVSIDYGVMDYDEYQKGICEPERYEDGSTRIENCAIYKIDKSKFEG